MDSLTILIISQIPLILYFVILVAVCIADHVTGGEKHEQLITLVVSANLIIVIVLIIFVLILKN